MTTLQALICDLDMTLIDSRHDIAAALARTLRAELGLTVAPDDAARLIGKPLRHMVRALAPDADRDAVLRCIDHYKRDFFEHCVVQTTIYPGVTRTLSALRERGVKIAVATTKMSFMARRVCRALELDDLLDHVQGTDDFPAKPDPSVILRACAALGVAPEQAAVVGDTTMDVHAAIAAGATAVAVTYGVDDPAALRAAEPHHLFDEFAAVATLF